MNTPELDIQTPKEKLPTTGYSIILNAPHGFPIRDNARSKIMCLCLTLEDAKELVKLIEHSPK
jgi:hypothetical protein